MVSAETENHKYKVQVLDRAFSLFNVLASSGSPLTAAELCVRAHLNKTTAHRLLTTLERYRFLEKDRATARYSLGNRFHELSAHASGARPVTTVQHIIESLAEKTGEGTRFGILHMGEEITMLHRSTSTLLQRKPGLPLRVPIHCTALGKALVAFEPALLERLLPYYRFRPHTRHTILSAARFRAEVKKVQRSGYAIDNEEFEEGLRCIGAPVFGASGCVVAAIGLTGPASRMGGPRSPELIRCVLSTAKELSSATDLLPFISSGKLAVTR